MTSTRPATPASDASNASFTCSSGKLGPSYPLDQVNEAFDASLAGSPGRVLVTPGA